MSMGEVALEARDYADILVGAEGMEPAFGWPYRRLIAKAKERGRGVNTRLPRTSPARSSRSTSRTITTSTAPPDDRRISAAIDLRKLDDLVTSFQALVKKLIGLKEEATTSCCWRTGTRRRTSSTNTLISGTCVNENHRTVAGVSSTECKAVDPSRHRACVIKSGCSGFAYQHSHGLSIYFPWAFVSPDYRNLQFAQVTGWYDFLEKHIKETQREPRLVAEVRGAVAELADAPSGAPGRPAGNDSPH